MAYSGASKNRLRGSKATLSSANDQPPEYRSKVSQGSTSGPSAACVVAISSISRTVRSVTTSRLSRSRRYGGGGSALTGVAYAIGSPSELQNWLGEKNSFRLLNSSETTCPTFASEAASTSTNLELCSINRR